MASLQWDPNRQYYTDDGCQWDNKQWTANAPNKNKEPGKTTYWDRDSARRWDKTAANENRGIDRQHGRELKADDHRNEGLGVTLGE